MTMYDLRETMCFIYSAHLVKYHYFRQMTKEETDAWRDSWEAHQAKLITIMADLPSTAITIVGKGIDVVHYNEANIKLYEKANQVIKWAKRRKEILAAHSYDGWSSYMNWSTQWIGTVHALDDELDEILEIPGGLGNIAGKEVRCEDNSND